MRTERAWICLVAALVLGACGSGSDVEVDPAVAPFVGTWDAVVLTMTSEAAQVIDVLEFGEFYISVEPSGQYTATLVHPLGAAVEIGRMSVVGTAVVLDPSHPPTAPTATSEYAFQGEDYLVLDGPTTYDFNNDQVDDPAQAHIELQRR